MRDENLDGISVDEIAKRTDMYSGSDIKNLCVAAALASVKETLVREILGSSTSDIESKDLKDIVVDRLATIEDWSEIVKKSDAPVPDRVIKREHFETAFVEVPASLSENAETLIELRRWDKQYGEGSARKKKTGYGFGLGLNVEKN
ncbi:hypothetical protein HK096_001924 [Nowakowskiella sp. JEL0078]|nr:hypothetical protein HK096_001924 [Nowakowskiella sp. JEL0078]